MTQKSGTVANHIVYGEADRNSTLSPSLTNRAPAQYLGTSTRGVTSDLILSDAHLLEITGKTRRSAQRRVLDYLRIPYRLRPDGSLVVHRASVDESLGVVSRSAPKKKAEPNWDN